MKEFLRIIFIALLFAQFASCEKEDSGRTLEQDQLDLETYITSNGITTEPTASGLYYIENVVGNGFSADSGEFLIIEYTLSTINGKNIATDQVGWIDMSDSYIMVGLAEGLKKMNENGEATMIIPSEIAYGSNGGPNVEGNMSIVIDVRLLESKGVEEEKVRLLKYVADSGISVQPTASGLYFIEEIAGDGIPIMTGDAFDVAYKGMLLNGIVFDEGSFSYTHNVTSVIAGFKEGVGLMTKGGKATVIMPYREAYGSEGNYAIPPYSSLIFEIEIP